MATDNKKKYTVGGMPGTHGFTMACFEAKDVPVGTVIYTEAQVMELVEIIAKVRDMANMGRSHFEIADECREALSKFRGEA